MNPKQLALKDIKKSHNWPFLNSESIIKSLYNSTIDRVYIDEKFHRESNFDNKQQIIGYIN